jgi:hypothetical protein
MRRVRARNRFMAAPLWPWSFRLRYHEATGAGRLRWWFSQKRKKTWPLAVAPPEAGPDFLCIGMPKSATGWLFDQLRYHPDFWLPSIKEFRYLFLPRPTLHHALRRHALYADPMRQRTTDPAELAFTAEIATLAGRPMDIEAYAALFRYRGERLCGDLSPGYCRAQPEEIAQVAARFPNAKILLLVRDPVSRLWSHLSMAWREKGFDESVLSDPARFHAWFETSLIYKEAYATETLRRWREYAPNLPLRTFLFDDILNDPAFVRREILSFLGADPRGKSGKLAVHFNRKARQDKMALTEAVEQMLIAEMADEVRACAETFGGAAKNWPARYGL